VVIEWNCFILLLTVGLDGQMGIRLIFSLPFSFSNLLKAFEQSILQM
jgi:hypothetical protein